MANTFREDNFRPGDVVLSYKGKPENELLVVVMEGTAEYNGRQRPLCRGLFDPSDIGCLITGKIVGHINQTDENT